jgi:hypothetical protein
MRRLLLLSLLFVGCDDGPTAALDAQVDADVLADAQPMDAQPVDAELDGELDAGPDARPPVRPGEAPLDGPATLDGPDDLLPAVAPGLARAGRVDTVGEALTGPDAQCRPGCFRLDNALISVCIQGAVTFSQLTHTGGNLVDAYPAGMHGTDRLREIDFTPTISGEVVVEQVGIVRDGSDGGPAVVRVEGRTGGGRLIQSYLQSVTPDAKVITEYRLAPDANTVDVLTWIEADQGSVTFPVYDIVVFGDRTSSFFPGAPSDTAPHGNMELLAATGQTAYGWSVNDAPFTVISVPIDEFPFRLVTLGAVSLQPGDAALLRRRLHVGRDVAEIQAPSEGDAVVFTGPPGAWINVDDGETQITRLRLDADGQREITLPAGIYRASSLRWPGGDPEPVGFMTSDGAVAMALAAPAQLHLTATDTEGNGIPASVMLHGPGGTRHAFILDEDTFELPAGAWQITTSRGWHYSADTQQVELAAGARVDLAVELTEEIPFDGHTSGEFHQHASLSLDSEVPNEVRILSNLGAGVGFMVPSDHDVIFDYRSLAERMGVLDRIALPVPSVEISPRTGHLGGIGVPYNPQLGAGGAPSLIVRDENGEWRSRTIPELVTAARALGAEIIQVNHPRDSTGFFDTVGLDTAEDISEFQHTHWTDDLDTVEVYNGRHDFCMVLSDWMGLLNQGMRLTAVGNSDTHDESDPPGFPRNYLPTDGARAQDVTGDEVITALREGRVVVGGGMVLDFPAGPQPGDTVAANDTVAFNLRLRTPSYAQALRLLAFYNGQLVLDRAVEADTEAIVDLDEVVEIPVDGDGSVVFLALGNPSAPHVGGPVFALSNPVWVDADSDGAITPVGPGAIELPAMSICD